MTKNFKILSFILLIFYSTQTIAEDKILFIDIEYIYMNSVAGKKVNEFVIKEKKKIDKDFSNYKKEIDDEKNKLVNKKNILSKEEFQKSSINLQKKVKNLNNQLSKKNNELIRYQNKAKVKFSEKLRNIVATYANENSISMIIKKNNILIGKNELDATKDILILVDKDIKTLKID